MKLREIYETAVRMGIEADPRGKAGVDEFLARTRKRYDALPEHLKALADPDELTNPFNDTRIYVGDPDTEVTTLIGGIDMNTGEVLLADRLREKGVPVDAIYTHHPEGWGLTKLDSVMEVQADIWAGLGVPIQAGEKLIMERMDEVRRRLMPLNYDQAVDAARLLGVPVLLGAHADRQPRGRLPQQVLRQEEAELSSRTCSRCCSRSPSTASPRRRAPARTSARAAPAPVPARYGST